MIIRFTCLLSLIFLSTSIYSADSDKPSEKSHQPKEFAVASAHFMATQAGINILKKGGNAFDAAVTVAAMLGVVEPYSAGIGGGGFWLLHTAKNNKTIMLDAREKAPIAAHRDMYLNKAGNVDRDKATNGALAAAIPGQAAAFSHITKHYGSLPLSETLYEASRFASKGFPASDIYINLAEFRRKTLEKYPDSVRFFLRDGTELKKGVIIRQPSLGNTLVTLSEKGADSFYKGELAKTLVKGVQDAGGIWTLKDLQNYQVIEREVTPFSYKNAVIWSAPPPSSGGIALAQMFGMLEQFDTSRLSVDDKTHLLVEVMRRAYRDRAVYMGDPDFVTIPTEKLISTPYLENLTSSISMSHATPSKELGLPKQTGSGTHTTHFSIIDKEGNRVAATLSINLPFGSGFTVPKTGILLNNEMDDFSAKPGSPNAFGLIGSEANAIEPEKRPLSSMTPTFMEYGPKENRQLAIIGTPGGSRIITMVFLGLLEALNKNPPQSWVDKTRFHHQFVPDVIQYEPEAFLPKTIELLKKKGHTLKNVGRTYGDMHVIRLNLKSGAVEAASDQRRLGSSQVGVDKKQK